MKVAMIGAGYVGLTSGAVFADLPAGRQGLGNTVWVVRRDKKKIENLKKGIVPIYEPGLSQIVKRNVQAGRLIPTTKYSDCVPLADVVFIAVGTPEGEKGADLSQVFEAAREIAKNLKVGYTVVVDKSTVPPGTADAVTEIINKYKVKGAEFDVVSSPEFLREGSAVLDTQKPDRVVIGSSSKKATDFLVNLHRPLKCPMVITSVRSAEIIKYSANAYLALRIGFIDQIANFCEKMGADVMDVVNGIGLDRRIGTHYWFPGMGYGGYCFPKDVKALVSLFNKVGEKNNLFAKLDELNSNRYKRFVKKLEVALGPLKGKKIGVLGLSAKPETDDIRGSVPLDLIEALIRKGALVTAFDPMAQGNAKLVASPKLKFGRDEYESAKGADALAVAAEWKQFKNLDFKKIRTLMKGNILLDAKNIYDPQKIKRLGFNYISTGRA